MKFVCLFVHRGYKGHEGNGDEENEVVFSHVKLYSNDQEPQCQKKKNNHPNKRASLPENVRGSSIPIALHSTSKEDAGIR